MINFTIKTLDSQNHYFSVEDTTTVEQLKEIIRERLGIEAHSQRLIFCGRVLQDDRRLADINVDDKVVHLVQKPPPSPESRNPRSQASTTHRNPINRNPAAEAPVDGLHQQMPRLMGLSGPPDFIIEQQQPSLTPTAGRLEVIRRMIAEIRGSLARLTAHLNSEPEPTLGEDGEPVPDNERPGRSNTRSSRSNHALRALRSRHTRPRDFAQLLDELGILQEEFIPHCLNYSRLLRYAHCDEAPDVSQEQMQHDQRIVDLVADISHSFAHAYHAVGDISFQVGNRNPRLHSEPVVGGLHQFPLQAHINLMQPNRRTGQMTSANGAAGSANPTTNSMNAAAGSSVRATSTVTSGNASAPATNTTAADSAAPTVSPSASSAMDTADNENRTIDQAPKQSATAQQTSTQPSGQIGGNTTATSATANANAQAARVTYEFQVETPVPIELPLENVFLNELANFAVTSSPQTPLPQQQTPQGQSQPNEANQSQNGSQAQGNRRQVLLDLENLLRGLVQTGVLGGVEVFMSMEEGPQVGNLPAGISIGQPIAAGIGVQQADGGVLLAPMPWGSNPPGGADFLQNIVASMVRQGLVPGAEGIAFHVTNEAQEQNRNQTSARPTQQRPQANSQSMPAQRNTEENAQQRQQRPGVHLRRAATTRAHGLSVLNLLYDGFLHCDSIHARRHVQMRRDQYEQQVAAQERLRAMRTVALNIETLRERLPSITEEHMTTLEELLNTNVQSPESWLNAFMTAIARNLFLAEPMRPAGSEPALIPNEFSSLRIILRNYIQDLITRSERTDGENAFQGVADFVVEEQSEFIRNISNITPIVPEIDIIETIRAIVRSRLPAIIATVMSDSGSEMFAYRFYGIFTRLFTDLCTIITLICSEGVDGLQLVYQLYMEHIMEDFDEPSRRLLLALSKENLNGILNSVRSHTDAVRSFIRYNDGFIDNASFSSSGPEPMEVSSPPASEASVHLSTASTLSLHNRNISSLDDSSSANLDNSSGEIDDNEPILISSDDSSAAISDDAASTSADTSFESEQIASTSTAEPTEPVAPVTPTRPATSNSTPPKRVMAETSEGGASSQRSPVETATNMQLLSPIMMLHQWGEEWVPVFTHDQQSQNTNPPEPYSDAYLSGMPAKKRRCIRKARPVTTLDGFMNESTLEAASRPITVEDDGPLRSALREHMRHIASVRSDESDDYDAVRYAATARFLRSPVLNNNQQPNERDENEQ